MIPVSSILGMLICCHSISLGVYNGSLALDPDLVRIAWQTKSVASSCRTSSKNMSFHVYRTRSIRILSSSDRCDPTLSFDDANQAMTSASGVVSSIILRASQCLWLVGNPIEDPNASSFSSSDPGRPMRFVSYSSPSSVFPSSFSFPDFFTPYDFPFSVPFTSAASPLCKQARTPRSNSWIQINCLLNGIHGLFASRPLLRIVPSLFRLVGCGGSRFG